MNEINYGIVGSLIIEMPVSKPSKIKFVGPPLGVYHRSERNGMDKVRGTYRRKGFVCGVFSGARNAVCDSYPPLQIQIQIFALSPFSSPLYDSMVHFFVESCLALSIYEKENIYIFALRLALINLNYLFIF